MIEARDVMVVAVAVRVKVDTVDFRYTGFIELFDLTNKIIPPPFDSGCFT